MAAPVVGSKTATTTEDEEKPSESSSVADETVVFVEEKKTITKFDDDEEERETFGSKLSYMLTLVGYAVGFGNVWRFPYLLQSNGGAAFLVPYVIMLTFLGIPTFFLEVAIGQRLQKGPVGTWNEISPYLAGIGVMSACICLIVGLYYTTLIAWCLAYFFDIYRSTLRWSSCSTAVKEWQFRDENIDCKAPDMSIALYRKQTSHNWTIEQACQICDKTGASQYYWKYEILNVSQSIEELGWFNPWILLYLILSWITVWAILFKGLKATGKVVYFSALFPYAVLLTFFICGLTLEGMENGYKVLFTPDWTKLAEAKTWMAAGTQIFFSLGVGYGVLIAFASHLPANNNCYRDAVSVALINCSTSLFAAVVIFGILGFRGTKLFNECKVERLKAFADEILFNTKLLNGYLADTKTNDGIQDMLGLVRPNDILDIKTYGDDEKEHDFVMKGIIRLYSVGTSGIRILPIPLQELQHKMKFKSCTIEDSVGSVKGTGLVFVAFADAIAQLWIPQLFAFLFYLMLFTLGIDSAFGTVEGAIAGFEDLKLKIKRWALTTIICVVLAVLSPMFAFGWGEYLLSFFDEFAANWTLLAICFFECIGIAWVYGLKKFAYDIKLMTGHRPNVFMMLCWKFISPLLMLGLMIASCVTYILEGITYTVWKTGWKDGILQGDKAEEHYPGYIIAIGFAITLLAMLPIPLFAILKLFRISPLKEEVPAYFPEEELQKAVNFVSHEEEEKTYTTTENVLFWGSGSPDATSKKSATSLERDEHLDDAVGHVSGT